MNDLSNLTEELIRYKISSCDTNEEALSIMSLYSNQVKGNIIEDCLVLNEEWTILEEGVESLYDKNLDEDEAIKEHLDYIYLCGDVMPDKFSIYKIGINMDGCDQKVLHSQYKLLSYKNNEFKIEKLIWEKQEEGQRRMQ